MIAGFVICQIGPNEGWEELAPAVVKLFCPAVGCQPAFIGLPKRENGRRRIPFKYVVVEGRRLLEGSGG